MFKLLCPARIKEITIENILPYLRVYIVYCGIVIGPSPNRTGVYDIMNSFYYTRFVDLHNILDKTLSLRILRSYREIPL